MEFSVMHSTQNKIILFFVLLLCTGSQLLAVALQVPQNFPTITAAILSAKKGDTVVVDPGVYHEHIYVNQDISLVSRSLFKAVIDGGGKGTVVTLGSNSGISGFEVRNGTIGIFTTAGGTLISQCKILYNQQTGIMCVGNLPKIEDNIVVYNKGSGIQGWDVRTTTASINHNTLAYNGNHGLSLGGNSSVVLENNILAFNSQFGIKPSEEAVRIQMINNNFYQNARFTDVLPSDNYAFNPLFINAPKLNFTLDKNSRCIGRASDNQNIGARVVY
jgi:hypothetical protein